MSPSALEQAAAGRDKPEEVAAALVLRRDAALVRYLDGIETVKPTFVRAARQAAGIEHADRPTR